MSMSCPKFEKASPLKVAVSVCVLCLSLNPAFACIAVNEPFGAFDVSCGYVMGTARS